MFEPTPLAAPQQTAGAPDWISEIGPSKGFVAENPYRLNTVSNQPETSSGEADTGEEIERAFEEGRAKGLAEGAELTKQHATERRALGSRLRRMDEAMIDQLGQQLSEAIVALCEVTLAPLALDRTLLSQRCTKAAKLLGETNSNCILRLHPGDIAALDDNFKNGWNISPDPDLAPGSLCLDGPDGGIKDGPAEWRAELMETLGLDPR